jgi:hypothetical protein
LSGNGINILMSIDMNKIHNIQEIRFDNDFFIIKVDNQTYKVKIAGISQKLANANEKERSEYTISPSGYGIHWPAIDEDLSIEGILKTIPQRHVA